MRAAGRRRRRPRRASASDRPFGRHLGVTATPGSGPASQWAHGVVNSRAALFARARLWVARPCAMNRARMKVHNAALAVAAALVGITTTRGARAEESLPVDKPVPV